MHTKLCMCCRGQPDRWSQAGNQPSQPMPWRNLGQAVWQAERKLHHLSMYWPIEAPARSCAPPSKRPKAETSTRELGYSSSMMRPMANSCRAQAQFDTKLLARAGP